MASATYDLVQKLIDRLSAAEKAQLLTYLAPKPEDEALEQANAKVLQMAGSSAHTGQMNAQVLPAKPLQQSTDSVAGSNLDTALAAMAAAADSGDEGAYLAAYRSVDWDKCDAATFEAAIHLAFAAGAHMAARVLATKGAALHPNSDYLQRAAYVLAPPTVIRRRPASNIANAANKEWMLVNRATYRGQWVALHNGELLGSAARLADLVDQFGIKPEILFTRVT